MGIGLGASFVRGAMSAGLHTAISVSLIRKCPSVPGQTATPAWIAILQQFDPRLVYFAHDRSVWVP